MPGISLDHFTRERGSVTQLEALSGSVLGIEVDHYLRRLIPRSRSPLYTPWAGVSQVLYKSLSEDLSVLKRLDIEPFFVFTGLQIPQQVNADLDKRFSARTGALSNLEKRRNEDSMAVFSGLALPGDLAPAMMKYLRQQQIGFLVAPFFAGPQLTYMLNTAKHIDAVYAAPDSLVFGIERLIIDITFAAGRFTFIDRSIVLAQLGNGITDDQFLDAYLFSGNEFINMVPILEQAPPAEYSPFRIRAAADVVKQNRSGFQALHNNPILEKKPGYMRQWQKVRALFRHHPYLDRDGDLSLLKADDSPNDLTEALGLRLPRELFYYLSRGLIEPEIVNAVSSFIWREYMPLDGGETREYKQLLDSLYEIRVQCIDLLMGGQILHNYYKTRQVVTKLYYEHNKDNSRNLPRNTPEIQHFHQPIEKLDEPLHNQLKTWRLGPDFLQKYGRSKSRDVQSLLHILQDPIAVEASRTSGSTGGGGPTAPMGSEVELDINVTYRLLYLRGYITKEHELSHWGLALLKALERVPAELGTETLLAVELLKLRSIKFEDFSVVYPPGTPGDAKLPPLDPQAKILPRIAAFVQLRQNDAPWQGPVDRNTLVAHSMADALRRTLAGLYDMIRLSLLLRAEAKRTPAVLEALARIENPFRRRVPDAGMAVCMKRYFDYLSPSAPGAADASGDAAAKGATGGGEITVDSVVVFEKLKNAFPTAVDLTADVGNAFKVWDAVHAAVGHAVQAGVMGNVEKEKFERTQTWLVSRRPS